ncbi:MAG TPA: SUMF1/EgtB/PvdO family nonheme iron enzyme [Cytophagaceae bacterium]
MEKLISPKNQNNNDQIKNNPSDNMVWIPGGTFIMGSDKHYPEERPSPKVTVSEFWTDKYNVTNANFKKFVDTTSYVPEGERPIDSANYPEVSTELPAPGSLIFTRGGLVEKTYEWEGKPFTNNKNQMVDSSVCHADLDVL